MKHNMSKDVYYTLFWAFKKTYIKNEWNMEYKVVGKCFKMGGKIDMGNSKLLSGD